MYLTTEPNHLQFSETHFKLSQVFLCVCTRTHKCVRVCVYLCFVGDGQVELELCGELILGVEAVREIYPSDATVGVDLYRKRLDVVCRDYIYTYRYT